MHYPDGSTVPFRETFFFLGEDVFDWLTEWNPEGQWVPVSGSGDPEFRMRRRASDVREEVTPLSEWEGAWSTDDGSTLTLRHADGTSAFRVQLRGPGTLREGFVVWDPNAVGLRSVEVAGNGTLERVAWGMDESGLVRVVDAFDPEGHVRGWTERWSHPDSDGCFVATGRGTATPPRSTRYCRVSEEAGPPGDGVSGGRFLSPFRIASPR